MPPGQNKIVRTDRSVIEGKLLATLDERGDVVAMLLSKVDLELMIAALQKHPSTKARDMALDLRQLHREAFK